jgi:RNA 2',3'-cyclic 3'-phosphodiesterase
VRVFLGFPIPPFLASVLYSSFADKRAVFPDIRWVKPANYHITVLFLGEIDENECSRIVRILDGLSFNGGVQAACGNIGRFPPRGTLRVLHAGLAAGEGYCRGVHAKICGVLPEYAENRPYTPHITLGRVKRGCRVSWTGPVTTPPKDPFRIEEIILFQSILGPAGPLYSRIHATRL